MSTTLNEAIKHALNIAEKQEELAKVCVAKQAKDDCLKCAVEHRQLAEWLKELAERRKQPGWTQISEGYPKIGQRVLVTLVDGTMDIRRCKLAEYFDCYYGDVIAWMPAPEPYQSEAERRTDV